jgi:hypothetical protein
MTQKGGRRVRYRAGDVFQIPLPDGSFGYGRLLLDIRRLARTGLFTPPCALAGICGSGLLVQLYRVSYPEPLASVVGLRAIPVFLSEFVQNGQIYRAEFPIVGNLPVAPEEIDFPEYTGTFVTSPEWQFLFEKGAVVARARIGWDERAEWDSLPKASIGFGLAPDLILRDIGDPDGVRRHTRGDLRGDLRRDGVLARVGLSPDMTYDQMCEVVGGVKAAELLLASEAEPSAADVTSDVKPVTRDDG